MSPADFRAWLADKTRRSLVMGVINVTPDSFSDGGRFMDADAAEACAARMIDEGADLIDVGGETTKPGSLPVPAEEQICRVTPIIRYLRERGMATSIDTTRAAVAAAACDAGACLVNDISGGGDDPSMFSFCARLGAPIVLMHMQGKPVDMQLAPMYGDVVAEVKTELLERATIARNAGIPADRILLDPGIGFGKTFAHNMALLGALASFAELPYPLLVGVSRKSFIGKITDAPVAADRVMGTAAAVAYSIDHGAAVVRVHDVGAMRQVVAMSAALRIARLASTRPPS